MPNHITNTVTFSGSAADLAAIRSMMDTSAVPDGCTFDFNGIIPMPESMNIESGTTTDVGRWLIGATERDGHAIAHASRLAGVASGSKTREELAELLKDHECVKMARIYESNLTLYGHGDWYGWCRDKWGTKWNSYRCTWLSDTIVRFETAWASPRPVFEAVHAKFPGVKIEVLWTDEGESDDVAHRYVLYTVDDE